MLYDIIHSYIGTNLNECVYSLSYSGIECLITHIKNIRVLTSVCVCVYFISLLLYLNEFLHTLQV